MLHQQKENICLPTNVLFLFIQAAVGVPRSELAELLGFPQAWHIISPCGAGYHHCNAVYLITRQRASCLRIDDIPQQVADDIQGCALICL